MPHPISDRYQEGTNVLLVTLDSCRWDTFQLAKTPNLDSLGTFLPAYSQGTYTYPAHLSIFSGILPNVREPIPLYNRFKKNLFRIGGRITTNPIHSYIEFPEGTQNIIKGFEALGHSTFGCAALEWFKHPNLHSPFQEFRFTGIDFSAQLTYIQEKIRSTNLPFFAFVNVGETHEPYEFGKRITPTLSSRKLVRTFENVGFLDTEFNKQVKAIEFIDERFESFIKLLAERNEQTLIIICGDHGECFGEEGLYGHGFYHPKVMEVPLGIFMYNPKPRL